MFDVLIREMAVRFGLGDKGLPLMQMLLAYMTQKETGGLPGFLEKFKTAGLGPIIQSWLGGGPSAQPVSNSQLETVLGGSGGLLSQLTAQLDAPRDNITSAVGYVLPPLVGKLTPGGSMPSALPPEVNSMAATGQALLAAPAAASSAQAAVGGGSGAMMKWLPWVVVAAAALFGLSYCNKNKSATAPAAPTAPVTEPPAVTAPASTPEPMPMASSASASTEVAPPETPSSTATATAAPLAPASETAPVTAPETMPAPATDAASGAASAASATAPVAASAVAHDTSVPAGASVVTWTHNDTPALKVYFDTGKSEVPAQFATEAATLVEHLKKHPTAQAVISGFNDPTGNAALNAELSKNRAKAVQAALVAAGVPEERTTLEKPADTTESETSRAAARRVEVTIRP